MKNFDWTDVRWAVVKGDGTFAGVPCASYGEARDLAAQHEGAKIFFLAYEPDELNEDDEPAEEEKVVTETQKEIDDWDWEKLGVNKFLDWLEQRFKSIPTHSGKESTCKLIH